MPLDDPALAAPATRACAREPLHFADGLFGWYHEPAAPARDCVAVLCPPMGPEYTRSHRTLRHLADRLAAAGVATLRFDYHGTGDSAGGEDEPERLGHWRRSIAAAAREARRLSGCERLCLVGVRLGATLAALESCAAQADLLVLWNPVVKGRAYARELQALAMTASAAPDAAGDGIESAGWRVSRETLDALKAIDLSQADFRGRARVLAVDRDDLAGDPALAADDRIAAPGWNGMMADHQFTVVPDAALDTIRDWILRHAREGGRPMPLAREGGRPIRLEGITEMPLRFGADRHLFGILTRPVAPATKPAVVLLDAGSIHHVGPHRLYVRLARELAPLGYPVLRFDLEGIGDSVLRGPGRENHPYQENAIADLEAVLEGLRRDHGCERFVLLGVCSGAYHAFHGAFRLPGAPIERLVLVNPWTFQYREGMSLATAPSHYEDVAAYGKSARDPARWKRLLRGEVDLARLARVLAAHVAKLARGRLADLREIVRPGSASLLSSQLHRIETLGRRTHMILCDGEPAHAILATEAARATRRLLRSGALTVEHARGADHTFSRHAARDELIQRVLARLAP